MRRLQLGQEAGQTIVVLALMIVVLIGLVGLSVDVGNAYGRQRRMQSAVNAGALAGMSAFSQTKGQQDICADIQKALTLHGVNTDTRGSYTWRAVYYTSSSGTSSTAIDCTGFLNLPLPPTTSRIEVDGKEIVMTYFTKVLGRPTLPATGVAYACPGDWPQGVFPLAMPFYLDPTANTKYQTNTWTIPARNVPLSPPNAYASSSTYDAWSNASGASATILSFSGIPTWTTGDIYQVNFGNNTAGVPGQHIGWVTLDVNGNGNAATTALLMAYPGLYINRVAGAASCSTLGCYDEAPVPSPLPLGAIPMPHIAPPGTPGAIAWYTYTSATQANGQLDVYDWVMGNTGVSLNSAMQNALDDHMVRGDDMLLPMYGMSSGNGRNGEFQILGIGRFELVKRHYQGNNSTMVLQYTGAASTRNAQSCAAP